MLSRHSNEWPIYLLPGNEGNEDVQKPQCKVGANNHGVEVG